MDKNVIIGILVVLLIGGGIWALAANGVFDTTPATTDTTPTTTTTTTTTTTDSGTPAAPGVTTGALVAASNSGAVLTGRIVPNGSPTSYWYEYGRTNALGSKSIVQAVGSGYASISAPVFIGGLMANTTYSYRLVASNALGTTAGAIMSMSTNNNPAPLGSAPAAHTDSESDLARTSVQLNAHVTPNGADTTYWFEYGTTANLGATTVLSPAGAGKVSVAVTAALSGLQPATKYYYRVDAQNQFGTVVGSTQSFTTSGPAAALSPSVDTLAATNVGNTSATAHGQVNPNGASTTYWFEYSTDSLLGSILGSSTHQTVAGSGQSMVNVSANLSGLARGTTYSYRLVAQNAQGTVRGDIVSFTTK